MGGGVISASVTKEGIRAEEVPTISRILYKPKDYKNYIIYRAVVLKPGTIAGISL